MGSIDKYCPCCGSCKVFCIEIHFESDISEYELEGSVDLYYECGDCHSEWEPHIHTAVHQYGRA